MLSLKRNIKIKTSLSGFGLLLILVFFNIAIPKGGFKINDIPITWGYILLFLFIPLFFAIYLKSHKKRVKPIVTYLLTLLFGIYSIVFFFLNEGYELGKLVSFLSSVILLPVFFLIFCSTTFQHVYDTKWAEFINYINKIILFISVYGIILFLYRNITGEWFEIAGITVNFQDASHLDWKYNDRGLLTKLISTYNNGNIYGVCMLLLLPFTELLDNKKIRFIAILSLLLTLSRTVWIGLIIYLILLINKKTLIKIIALIPILVLAIFFIIDNMLGFDVSSFLISKNLGGRLGLITSINTTLFYNTETYFEGIGEIVYASIINYYGLFGLFLFLLFLLSPIIINHSTHKNFIILRKSIITYVILAMADGAFNYIPVMFIFWFISGILTINFSKQIFNS